MKLRDLLSEIRKKQIFVKPVAHVYTVEFQKRGLPHAHILIILCGECKAREYSDYDKIVCAEISVHKTQPILYSIVKHCMIHGSCGILKRSPSCMLNDYCT